MCCASTCGRVQMLANPTRLSATIGLLWALSRGRLLLMTTGFTSRRSGVACGGSPGWLPWQWATFARGLRPHRVCKGAPRGRWLLSSQATAFARRLKDVCFVFRILRLASIVICVADPSWPRRCCLDPYALEDADVGEGRGWGTLCAHTGNHRIVCPIPRSVLAEVGPEVACCERPCGRYVILANVLYVSSKLVLGSRAMFSIWVKT